MIIVFMSKHTVDASKHGATKLNIFSLEIDSCICSFLSDTQNFQMTLFSCQARGTDAGTFHVNIVSAV